MLAAAAAVVFRCLLWHPVCSGLVSFFFFWLAGADRGSGGSPIPEPRQRSRLFRSHSESSDEVSELDLSHGKKDAFVLEVCIYKDKNIYMLRFLRTSVTIWYHSKRLMTLMLWRTSTPSSLMLRSPQVCSIAMMVHHHHSLHMLCLLIGTRLLQMSLLSASSPLFPFPLFCLQGSTAATLRSCLESTTGHQQFRSLLIILFMFLSLHIALPWSLPNCNMKEFWVTFPCMSIVQWWTHIYSKTRILTWL